MNLVQRVRAHAGHSRAGRKDGYPNSPLEAKGCRRQGNTAVNDTFTLLRRKEGIAHFDANHGAHAYRQLVWRSHKERLYLL